LVDVAHDGKWTIVRLSGDLDIATVAPVRETVDQLIADGHTQLRFDLGGVDFLDSQGFGLLVRAEKAVRPAGGQVQVIGVSENTRPLFKFSGLDAFLGPDE
jgi:anti-anti-sigma factor